MLRASGAMASVALVLAALAAAAQAPPAQLPGLWEGRIGTLPVRACFGRQEWGDFGGYYYRSKLKHIALEPVDGDPATFAETYSPGKPQWHIDSATAAELRGQWTSGGRSLPIRLARVTGVPAAISCQDVAFHAPRLAGIRTVTSRAAKDGVGYTRLVLDPKARFDASVETFALDGASPAIRRLNAALREPLDGDPPQWFDCVREPLERSAFEGSFHETLAPALITPRWLSVVQQHDLFCGGAYPDSGQTYRLFELASGREVDLHDWLNARAVKREGPAGTDEEIKTLQPEFRRFLLAGRRPDPDSAECDEVVKDEEYWNIGLTAKGLVFAPELAHAVQACGFELTFTAERLAPFLTPPGAANLRAAEAGRQGI
jgi:hypothetical protein